LLYHHNQFNLRAVYDHFARMFKIHRDLAVDRRLHLSQPPIGLLWVADKIPGRQKIIHPIILLSVKVPDMPQNQTDLAATIGARICHDLISPIGAISNGLELLALAGGPESPEMALITESVRCANAKVRLFRVAFGSAGTSTPISTAEVREILNDAYSDPRLKIHWEITAPVPHPDLQLLFLLTLCTEKLAPFGGNISFSETAHGFGIVVTGKSLRPDGYLDFNSHRLLPQIGPPLVQFGLAETRLERLGYRLELTQSDGEIRFDIKT